MTPTPGRAVEKSPSQARVTPPSPIRSRTWLTRPSEASSQLQMIPAATSGMTCGRNSTVRATTASLLAAIWRMEVAMSSPSVTGTKLKKAMSWKALRIAPYSAESVTMLA